MTAAVLSMLALQQHRSASPPGSRTYHIIAADRPDPGSRPGTGSTNSTSLPPTSASALQLSSSDALAVPPTPGGWNCYGCEGYCTYGSTACFANGSCEGRLDACPGRPNPSPNHHSGVSTASCRLTRARARVALSPAQTAPRRQTSSGTTWMRTSGRRGGAGRAARWGTASTRGCRPRPRPWSTAPSGASDERRAQDPKIGSPQRRGTSGSTGSSTATRVATGSGRRPGTRGSTFTSRTRGWRPRGSTIAGPRRVEMVRRCTDTTRSTAGCSAGCSTSRPARTAPRETTRCMWRSCRLHGTRPGAACTLKHILLKC